MSRVWNYLRWCRYCKQRKGNAGSRFPGQVFMCGDCVKGKA